MTRKTILKGEVTSLQSVFVKYLNLVLEQFRYMFLIFLQVKYVTLLCFTARHGRPFY